MDSQEAAQAVAAALAALGIPSAVRAAGQQVEARVQARDVLVRQGAVACLRAGLPAFAGPFPVRYHLEDGSTLGTHGPRGHAPEPHLPE